MLHVPLCLKRKSSPLDSDVKAKPFTKCSNKHTSERREKKKVSEFFGITAVHGILN